MGPARRGMAVLAAALAPAPGAGSRRPAQISVAGRQSSASVSGRRYRRQSRAGWRRSRAARRRCRSSSSCRRPAGGSRRHARSPRLPTCPVLTTKIGPQSNRHVASKERYCLVSARDADPAARNRCGLKCLVFCAPPPVPGWPNGLLSLLVVSFAVWGISGQHHRGFGAGQYVLTAGGTKVSPNEYQARLRPAASVMSQQLGSASRASRRAPSGSTSRCWRSSGRRRARRAGAASCGLGVSKDELAR